jgi:hypothetical protein
MRHREGHENTEEVIKKVPSSSGSLSALVDFLNHSQMPTSKIPGQASPALPLESLGPSCPKKKTEKDEKSGEENTC